MSVNFRHFGMIYGSIVILAACISMNCNGSAGGGGNPPTKAFLMVEIRDGGHRNPTDTCRDRRLQFTIDPVSLTGSDGWGDPINIDKAFSSNGPTGNSDGWYYCITTHVVTGSPIGGLRTGRWRIRAAEGVWSTTCEQTLKAGNNTIRFSLGKQGCTINSKFPGE